MSDREEWQLIPESECDDQDDYPDDAQIRRDIAGWEQEYADWSGYQLLPDEHFADEDTVDHATVFRDIKEGLEAAIAWERGKSEMRVTILTEDGQRIGPAMMTREQYDARLQELLPNPPDDFTTQEELEVLLVEGLNSGPAIRVTPEYWRQKQDRLLQRWAQKNVQP